MNETLWTMVIAMGSAVLGIAMSLVTSKKAKRRYLNEKVQQCSQ